MPTINLKLTCASYPIVIGAGESAKLQPLIHKYARSSTVFVICDAQVYALHGERLLRKIGSTGATLVPFVLPQGEEAKSERVLAGLYDFLLAHKISRSDFILACGGGVTTDVAGYAAATVLRGVSWGVVPTTLLGMVDAAIGGKTGINHSLGKNLLGAIWQPAFVSSDMDFLQTLPRRQIIAGCGELLKYAGLVGEPMLSLTERYLSCGDLLDMSLLPRLVSYSSQYKADIVSRDEREQNIRAHLNFGHTFAHAIEHVLGYGKLMHGEAVILGLVGAVSLSRQARPRSEARLTGYRKLTQSAVATVPARKLSTSDIVNAMSFDKKRSGRALRFVLLDRPGKPYIATDLSHKLITQAVEEMLVVYKQHGGRHAASAGRQWSES